MVSDNVNITEDDKEVIANIVEDLTGFLKSSLTNEKIEVIFDNKTLDTFIKQFIVMLNDVKKEGTISKYLDAAGNLELEVALK